MCWSTSCCSINSGRSSRSSTTTVTWSSPQLLLPALFLLSGVLCAVPVAVESVPTFEFRNQLTGEILTCAKCPPGTHMTAHCTASTPTGCAPCRSEHFTELWNYLPRCLYCNNICSENQEVETECSPMSNRVCRCTDGFYWANDFCVRHSECEPGQGVQAKGVVFLFYLREFCWCWKISTSKNVYMRVFSYFVLTAQRGLSH